MTFAYHRRVRALESRQEAFSQGLTTEEYRHATQAHYVSQGSAERAAAQLVRMGRPQYGVKYCEDCDDGYKLTKGTP